MQELELGALQVDLEVFKILMKEKNIKKVNLKPLEFFKKENVTKKWEESDTD